jgi:CO/xanthine dehydrogenase Mo-binding subunit
MTVGSNTPRLEGYDKVTGHAKYIDDYTYSDLWYGKTIRAPLAHGQIEQINFDWSQVVVVDYRDIPGRNVVALIYDDQPLLAETVVRHVGEAVLLIAAPSKELAAAAARAVQISYTPLPAALTIEDSLAKTATIFGQDNVFKHYILNRGSIEDAFLAAEVIVEETYTVGHQEQLYIEPNGIIATAQPDGAILIQGSLQCPYYVHRAIKELFDLPDEKVTVIQTVTGGGFGGKEDFPSVVAGHAALLARRCGHPVKIVYDRQEDFIASTKRHPAIIRHRTGLTREGRLLAAEIDLTFDGGAYCTLSPVVLSRGVIHALGPYKCPNIRVTGRVVATNTPPNGAFRGFGVPQACFAAETHMEKIARTLQLSPGQLRRQNMLHEGDITVTGQQLSYSVGTQEVFDAVVERSNYFEQQQAYATQPVTSNKRRGIGLSFYYHGGGFTGSGEERIKGRAALELLPQGQVCILTASTEIGQGTRTIFAQIVATELGIPIDRIIFGDTDTDKVPDSGPTVASRTCMVVGRVVQQAATKLAQVLQQYLAHQVGQSPENVTWQAGQFTWSQDGQPQKRDFASVGDAYLAQMGALQTVAQYQSPPGIKWDDSSYLGDAYPVFSYAADIVEVEVDLDTYTVQVLNVITASDIGKAINPAMCAGQIEGGTVQALGYGLCEEVVWKDGHMLNPRLTNYIIPTALDVPDMETILIEKPYPYGPFGAKGIGELPMDGGAPALIAAIANATGALITTIPATPERLLAALSQDS